MLLAAGCATFAVLAVAAFPRPAAASFPSNFRVRPTRVVDAGMLNGTPRVRIEGFFAYTGTAFGAPVARCGVMDFFCRSDEGLAGDKYCSGGGPRCLQQCRTEWADITAAAAAGTCVTLQANLWRTPEMAVQPIGAPFVNPDPYDGVMGVATVPCHPAMPSPDRPDLPDVCRANAAVDAGSDAAEAGTSDAAPGPGPDATVVDGNDRADALDSPVAGPDAATPTATGGTGAGGTGGSTGGATAGPSGGAGGSSRESGGCAVSRRPGGDGAAAGLLALAILLGPSARRRMRR
jgi:hypothetical protein